MVVGEFTESADVLVIGGGPGGYVAAIRAAQLGMSVTLVEREDIGGVCLNRGCIPSKALIATADQYYRLAGLKTRGIDVTQASLDFSRVQAHKEQVVKKLTSGVAGLLKGHNVSVIRGTARFVSRDTVRVVEEYESKKIQFKKCIVATGSRTKILPNLVPDGDRIVGSTEALQWDAPPGHLIVVGGGYIGLELGTVYRKFGSRVTVVEATPHLLPGVDPALVQVVQKRLKDLEVSVFLSTTVKTVERERDGLNIVLEGPKADALSLSADKMLVTVGRQPNTDDLGLDAAGIRVDDRGFIAVDTTMRTANPLIYAIGDVVGNPMLAHKASHEGQVAAEAIAGLPAAMDVVAIPAVIFTDPEIASVGLTEAQAKESGYDPVVGRFPFAANGRALTVDETTGFVQVISDKTTQRILGVHMVGPEASNLIAEGTLALEMGATVTDLALTVHAHPTLPEALLEAAEASLGHPIHILKR